MSEVSILRGPSQDALLSLNATSSPASARTWASKPPNCTDCNSKSQQRSTKSANECAELRFVGVGRCHQGGFAPNLSGFRMIGMDPDRHWILYDGNCAMPLQVVRLKFTANELHFRVIVHSPPIKVTKRVSTGST